MYCDDSADDAPTQRRKTERENARHQELTFEVQYAICEELTDCCAEYIRILKRRHSVTLHYYDLRCRYDNYRVGSLVKLRKLLDNFPFGARSLWYELDHDGRRRSFPFDDFTPLVRLRRIHRHLASPRWAGTSSRLQQSVGQALRRSAG